MIHLEFSPTHPFISSDLTSEARAFIDSYRSKNNNTYIQYRELVKGLIIHILRPEFIYEVLRQVIQFHTQLIAPITINFVENITDEQILNLTKTKDGNYLLTKLFTLLSGFKSTANSTNLNNIIQSVEKIEKVRFQIIVGDKRPLIADMVENNDGLYHFRFERNLDDFWLMERNALRFGLGHDGEHILGNRNGSRVKAIAGITGVILTYFKQLPDDNYAVYILLDNNIVLVLKDLINLSTLVLKSVNSTKQQTVPKFIDRLKPIKGVKLQIGDTIGFTAPWSGDTNRSATGLHFNFVKYQFIQQYRDALGRGENVMSKYPTWFIVPCGSQSPVRCK